MNERDGLVIVLLLAAGVILLPIGFGVLVTPWSMGPCMMPWMMGGTGWIGCVALWGLIAVGAVLVVMNARTRRDDDTLTILKTRYARDEITADEYETMRRQFRT